LFHASFLNFKAKQGLKFGWTISEICFQRFSPSFIRIPSEEFETTNLYIFYLFKKVVLPITNGENISLLIAGGHDKLRSKGHWHRQAQRQPIVHCEGVSSNLNGQASSEATVHYEGVSSNLNGQTSSEATVHCEGFSSNLNGQSSSEATVHCEGVSSNLNGQTSSEATVHCEGVSSNLNGQTSSEGTVQCEGVSSNYKKGHGKVQRQVNTSCEGAGSNLNRDTGGQAQRYRPMYTARQLDLIQTGTWARGQAQREVIYTKRN
jgi:hypothetical protein